MQAGFVSKARKDHSQQKRKEGKGQTSKRAERALTDTMDVEATPEVESADALRQTNRKREEKDDEGLDEKRVKVELAHRVKGTGRRRSTEATTSMSYGTVGVKQNYWATSYCR